MTEDGSDTKDDVKIDKNDKDVGTKIVTMFEDGKDVSKYNSVGYCFEKVTKCFCQTNNANSSVSDVIILSAMGEESAMEAKEAPK